MPFRSALPRRARIHAGRHRWAMMSLGALGVREAL
jgi:hypothetical protein